MNASESLSASLPFVASSHPVSREVAAPVSNVAPLHQHTRSALRHVRRGELLMFAVLSGAALVLLGLAFALR